jgi:hypothetical protein
VVLGEDSDPYNPNVISSPADAVSVREKAGSTSVSFLAAVGIFVVVSMAAGLVGMFAFAGFKAGMPGASPSGTDAASALADATPPWFKDMGLVVACAVAAVGAARAGAGTVGDAVFSIRTRTTDGRAPSRVRQLARAAIPMALVAAGTLGGVIWLSVFVALAGSGVGLLRADRRGVYELLTGLVQFSTAPVKTTREIRLAEAQRSREAQP